jgi:hypothetical protein
VRRTFPLASAAVAAVALISSAAATIVPQRGIAGVAIGMSQPMVRSVLGQPTSVKHASNDFGKYTILKYPGLQVTFQGNKSVTDVSTTRRGERTPYGVGVGSTEAQVKAKVRGVTCRTDGSFRHCYVGRFRPGRRVTDFSIKRGKVTRVDVGVVID